jgi:hypothetical protein
MALPSAAQSALPRSLSPCFCAQLATVLDERCPPAVTFPAALSEAILLARLLTGTFLDLEVGFLGVAVPGFLAAILYPHVKIYK